MLPPLSCLDLSRMLLLLGGSWWPCPCCSQLLSPGGEQVGLELEPVPQEEPEPELVELTEFVLWRGGGMPCASLLFIACEELFIPKFGRPMVRAGFWFLLLFFLLLFCFSLSELLPPTICSPF